MGSSSINAGTWGVNNKHTRENNMTSYSANYWVTFDDEKDGKLQIETNKKCFPWAMLETKSTRHTSLMSGSFSSLSSGSNCASISSSAASSRGISPINTLMESPSDQMFTDLQIPEHSAEENIPEAGTRYSVFSSVRASERKGEYLGWSKELLGMGVMGWSEKLLAKHSA